MTGADVHILHLPQSSHAGPPPPSPPASIDNIDEEEGENDRVYSPRLTMPSQSEPPVVYEPSSTGGKTLQRASTDPRVLLSTTGRVATQPTPMEAHLSATQTTTTVTGPAAAPHVSRRHTHHHPQSQRLYQPFAPPQHTTHHHHQHPHVHAHSAFAQDDTAVLGDAAATLQSDIEIHAEQIRRERHSKRLKQQAQAEAEAALTRTDTRGTRGTRDEDDKPLVGNLIGEDHVNYVLMYNMLTGIRIGVSRCQAKMKKFLTEEDFVAKHKYSFDMCVLCFFLRY